MGRNFKKQKILSHQDINSKIKRKETLCDFHSNLDVNSFVLPNKYVFQNDVTNQIHESLNTRQNRMLTSEETMISIQKRPDLHSMEMKKESCFDNSLFSKNKEIKQMCDEVMKLSAGEILDSYIYSQNIKKDCKIKQMSSQHKNKDDQLGPKTVNKRKKLAKSKNSDMNCPKREFQPRIDPIKKQHNRCLKPIPAPESIWLSNDMDSDIIIGETAVDDSNRINNLIEADRDLDIDAKNFLFTNNALKEDEIPEKSFNSKKSSKKYQTTKITQFFKKL